MLVLLLQAQVSTTLICKPGAMSKVSRLYIGIREAKWPGSLLDFEHKQDHEVCQSLLIKTSMQVYRDDALLKGTSDQPATKYPTAWVLIWRSNSSKPVTMWKPVAPAGYRPLGTVCVSRPDQPKLEQALCVRGDLIEPSSSFEAPIWTHQPEALSQVNSPICSSGSALGIERVVEVV